MPAKVKKPFKPNHAKENEIEPWRNLSPYGTVPKTIRFPEQVAAQIDYLALRMNTTTGKLLLGILEDVLPMFLEDRASELRQLKVYRAMRDNDLLTAVNWDELLEKIRFASNRRE